MRGSQTVESRARISASNRGRVLSEETRAKMSAAHRGLKHSAATRAKMSASHRGRTGKLHTPETKAKISAALLLRCALKRVGQ